MTRRLPYLTPFEVRDFLRSQPRAIMEALSCQIDQLARDNPKIDFAFDVQVVEVGRTLEQGAWVDRTGFYAKVRPANLYKDNPMMKEMALNLAKAFAQCFHNKGAKTDDVFFHTDDEGVITVVVERETCSIGD